MSEKPTLNVVTIRDHSLRDHSAMLRRVADNIDAGEYGAVGEIALVVMGDQLHVFGFGPAQDGTSTTALLQAGAMRQIYAIASHGRETP